MWILSISLHPVTNVCVSLRNRDLLSISVWQQYKPVLITVRIYGVPVTKILKKGVLHLTLGNFWQFIASWGMLGK